MKSATGSLRDFGIGYQEIDVLTEQGLDLVKIEKVLAAEPSVKVVFIQRSKGYLDRRTLSVSEIGDIARYVKERSSAYVVVDNCYGEFTELSEPTALGADLIIGSLIKNPGGGLARSGGYLAGSQKAVELCSYRLTSVGIGAEAGASLGQNREMFQGFFNAPHTVAQALKTAALAAYVFSKMGYTVEPARLRRGMISFNRSISAAPTSCAPFAGAYSMAPRWIPLSHLNLGVCRAIRIWSLWRPAPLHRALPLSFRPTVRCATLILPISRAA